MLILLAVLAGVGLMIKYVLLPGFKRNILPESNAEFYFWGLDRHQWGSIHLYLGYVFMFLLFLHIILHWKMIVGIFKPMVKGQLSRKIILISTGVAAVFFTLAPLFIKPELRPTERKYTHRQTTELSQKAQPKQSPHRNHELTSGVSSNIPEHKTVVNKLKENSDGDHHKQDYAEIEIYGWMTLKEISQKFSVPLNELSKAMNIPLINSNKKLGKLRSRYGFKMSEIKKAIIQLQNEK